MISFCQPERDLELCVLSSFWGIDGIMGARLASCRRSSSSYDNVASDDFQEGNTEKTDLQTSDIDGEDSHEKCMCKEPMGHQDNNCKATKLTHGASREECNHSEDRIIRNDF